jgi:hypothetical protein
VNAFHEERIETPAGTYTVEFHTDHDPRQPEDEGFVLVVDGWEPCGADSRIDIEYGDVPDVVTGALRTSGRHREDSWEWELRSVQSDQWWNEAY